MKRRVKVHAKNVYLLVGNGACWVMFRGSIATVACDGVKDACKRCKSGANMAKDIALEVAERNADNVQYGIIVALTKIRPSSCKTWVAFSKESPFCQKTHAIITKASPCSLLLS